MNNFERRTPIVYEQLNPADQFKDMAKAILKEHGEEHSSTAPGWKGGKTSISWPVSKESHHYQLYRRKYDLHKGVTTDYVLEHFAPNSAEPVRYRVRNSGPIRLLDTDGQQVPLEKNEQRIVNYAALSILTRAWSTNANEIIQDQFTRSFRSVVGDYILSSLAVKVDGISRQSISEEDAVDAVVTFSNDLLAIYEDVALNEQPDTTTTSEGMQKAIDDFMNPPKKYGSRSVDTISLAKASANALRHGWRTVLPADA